MLGDRGTRDGRLRTSSRLLPFCFAVFLSACGGDSSNGGGGQCGTIDACGGDLTGTWKVTAICASESPTPTVSNSDGSSLPAACQAGITPSQSAIQITPDATATFTGTELVETGSFQLSYPVTLTNACLSALGAPPADSSVCDQIGAGLTQTGTGTGSCAVAPSGGCACTLSLSEPIDVSGPYEIQGDQLVTDNGMFKSSYCVSGANATLLENGLGISGKLQLTRAGDAGM